MRFKAILAEAARKRYPLSILLIVLGILIIPFPWLFIRFGLELAGAWWTVLGICIGLFAGCGMIGLGSLVEDIHDISMHTVGFDLEITEPDDVEIEYDEEPEDAEPEADDGLN